MTTATGQQAEELITEHGMTPTVVDNSGEALFIEQDWEGEIFDYAHPGVKVYATSSYDSLIRLDLTVEQVRHLAVRLLAAADEMTGV